ncbi:uncharacterized protein TNCV_1647881 [Trichonephila clavipes]|uniref:Uncharacterized protein n=1 Tax=Trichonephila clavipes TaxID=2585209 RepID=A0A8X6V6Y3_TRICX|nr:uncharacterized protein TNCV_1647881 [Trichonephila clavipes]
MSKVWKRTPTRQCPIKERQENPFCINCQEYGHSACYTECPKFPKPKKGTPLTANKTFESNVRRKGVSFTNIVSGTSPPPPPPHSTSTIFEAHSHHPIKATHEKSCACYPIGSCHRFPRPPSPAKEQNQADSKTR